MEFKGARYTHSVTTETKFVTNCMAMLHTKPLLKQGFTLKGKYLIPFRLDPFSEQLVSLESASVLLNAAYSKSERLQINAFFLLLLRIHKQNYIFKDTTLHPIKYVNLLGE